MNIHSSDATQRLSASELERLALLSTSTEKTSAPAHDTPTLMPPSDDGPPTVRWTPPPALLKVDPKLGSNTRNRR